MQRVSMREAPHAARKLIESVAYAQDVTRAVSYTICTTSHL